MSANHAWSGPSASKWRLTRSGAPSFLLTLLSLPSGLLAQRLDTPAQPRSRMMRATRFSEVETPSLLSCMKTLGDPYVRLLDSHTRDISDASSASRTAWALGALDFHW